MSETARPLALFDFDDTLIKGLSFMPLLETQVDEGLIPPSTIANARLVRLGYRALVATHENTAHRLLDIYASGLEGVDYEAVRASTQAFYAHTDLFYDYVAPTLELLAQTHDLALVTAEPQFVAEAAVERLGIEQFFSSLFEVHDGVLTGGISTYLAGRNEKKQAVATLLEGRPYPGSFGFGDSEGDTEMLKAVEHAICIKPNVQLRIRAMGHQALHGDIQLLGINPMADSDRREMVKPHDWTFVNEEQITTAAVLDVVAAHLERDAMLQAQT